MESRWRPEAPRGEPRGQRRLGQGALRRRRGSRWAFRTRPTTPPGRRSEAARSISWRGRAATAPRGRSRPPGLESGRELPREQGGEVRDHRVEDAVGAGRARPGGRGTGPGTPPGRPPTTARRFPRGAAGRGSRPCGRGTRRGPPREGPRPRARSREGRLRSSSSRRTRFRRSAANAAASPSAVVLVPSPRVAPTTPIRRRRLSRPSARSRAASRRSSRPAGSHRRGPPARRVRVRRRKHLLLERGHDLEHGNLGSTAAFPPLTPSPAGEPVVEAHAVELQRVAPRGLADGLAQLVVVGLQRRGGERAAPAGDRAHGAAGQAVRLPEPTMTRPAAVTRKARSVLSSTRARSWVRRSCLAVSSVPVSVSASCATADRAQASMPASTLRL